MCNIGPHDENDIVCFETDNEESKGDLTPSYVNHENDEISNDISDSMSFTYLLFFQ